MVGRRYYVVIGRRTRLSRGSDPWPAQSLPSRRQSGHNILLHRITPMAAIIPRKRFLIGKVPGSDEYIGERSQKTTALLERCLGPFNKKGFEASQYQDTLKRLDNERRVCSSFLNSLPTDLADLAYDLGGDFVTTAVTHGNKAGFSFCDGNSYRWFPTKGVAKHARWDLLRRGWSCDEIFPCGALEVIILEQWCDRTVSW